MSETGISSTIYFQLTDSNGLRWKHILPSYVALSPSARVVDLCSAVRSKYDQSYLKDIYADELAVYRNAEDLDNLQRRLSCTHPLMGLGTDVEPLVVMVSAPIKGIKRSKFDWSEMGTQRKHRWMNLNRALEQLPQARFSVNNSAPLSQIPWNCVMRVFQPAAYEQDLIPILEANLHSLNSHFIKIHRFFSDIAHSNEAQRLVFILPIFYAVCEPLGDVKITIQESLTGCLVDAHGRYDLLLERPGKSICVLEAKRTDFDHGAAQNLVCCEVAAELGNWETVHGIVTDFLRWDFFTNTVESIRSETCYLHVEGNKPSLDSLKIITGKIHGILLSSEEKNRCSVARS